MRKRRSICKKVEIVHVVRFFAFFPFWYTGFGREELSLSFSYSARKHVYELSTVCLKYPSSDGVY